MMVVAMYP